MMEPSPKFLHHIITNQPIWFCHNDDFNKTGFNKSYLRGAGNTGGIERKWSSKRRMN